MIKKKHPDLWEAANHYPPKDETSELFQTYTNPIPEKLHRSTWITDHTIKFLEQRNKNKPFLLHCSFWDPHHPFAPPIPYNTIYNPIDMPEPIPSKENEFKNLPEHFLKFYTKEHNTKSGIRRYKSFKRYTMEDWKKIIAHYYGMISLIDKNIGRVLDYLRKENLLESTAIFFTSDHGELLGDHGLLTKGNYHYEGLLRVPFIFSYPYLYKGGRIFDNLILSYDLMPTILELAGVDKPKITAKSIIPLIKNRESPRKTVLIEGTNNIRTIIYKKKYKLTMYKESDEGELFDLKNDPNETKNLWKTEKKFKLMLLLELNKLQMGAIKPSEDCIGIW